MATVNGTNMTKALAPAPASYMGTEFESRSKTIIENYTFASAAAGTVVRVGILQKGETFIEAYITGADLGSATTLILGDIGIDGTTGDNDRYLAATVFTTAGQRTNCDAAAGRGYTATKDMYFIVTTAVEEASGLINVVITKACP